MTGEAALGLRVGRLENDSAALYELLDGFRGEFDEFRGETRGEFAKINGTLDDFRSRFGKIDGTLDEIHSRFGKIDGTLDEIVRRLPAIPN